MKRLILLLLGVALSLSAYAQSSASTEENGKEKSRGYLTGSFENNTIYYLDDSKSNAIAPDDHIGSVPVSGDHVYELGLGIGICLRILEPDGPVYRNLGPYHEPHLLSHTDHMFIMRIMGQSYEIASHLLGPAKQDARMIL